MSVSPHAHIQVLGNTRLHCVYAEMCPLRLEYPLPNALAGHVHPTTAGSSSVCENTEKRGARKGSSLQHQVISAAFAAKGTFPTQSSASAECFWQTQPARLTCSGAPAAILIFGNGLFPFGVTEITSETVTQLLIGPNTFF